MLSTAGFFFGALRVNTGQYTEHGSLGNEIGFFFMKVVLQV